MGLIHIKKDEGKKLLIIDHVLVEKLKANDTTNAYALGEIIVPPNASPPLHSHEAQESFYIIEGTFEFTTLKDKQKESFTAEKGDIVHVPSNVPHTFRNTGKEVGKIVGILNPCGMEVFFDKIGKPYNGEELVARKPHIWDMLKIGFLSRRFGIKFYR